MMPIVSTTVAIAAGIWERITHHIERALDYTGRKKEL